jgi:hypothetical protein
MAVDPLLLAQALRTPEDRDVRRTPIVRAVILADPANAADLVPALAQTGELVAANARRILCLFEAPAVPHLLGALTAAGARERKEGIEILWAMLAGENAATIRQTLEQSAQPLFELLDDRRALPDTMPEYVERDFRGRICDLAFIVLQRLIDPTFDQSLFRSLDDHGRDEEIRRMKSRGFGLHIA